MAEYIDLDKLNEFPIRAGHYDQEHGNKHLVFGVESVLEYVENLPAADVAPVVHGRWIKYPRAHYFKCSECKYTVPYKKAMLVNKTRQYNYCPHCGTTMNIQDGGDNDAAD